MLLDQLTSSRIVTSVPVPILICVFLIFFTVCQNILVGNQVRKIQVLENVQAGIGKVVGMKELTPAVSHVPQN